MSTTTSMMFRSATRNVFSISERLGRRTVPSLRSTQFKGANGSRATLSTQQYEEFESKFSDSVQSQHPQPLPALAYDYDYEVDEANHSEKDINQFSANSKEVLTAQQCVRHDVTSDPLVIEASSSGPPGRGPSSSTPYPPPSSMASSKGGVSRRGGAGGGGHHRCPKCGTTVTFRCDYEENTFYCASCSGWFVVNPNAILAGDDGKSHEPKFEEFTARNGTRKPDDPEILMRHVSNLIETYFLRYPNLKNQLIFFNFRFLKIRRDMHQATLDR